MVEGADLGGKECMTKQIVDIIDYFIQRVIQELIDILDVKRRT